MRELRYFKAYDIRGEIGVTASHNPINNNGMKIVKCTSQPALIGRSFI